jgi:hypothetical protein
LQSRITVDVVEGWSYSIRVGGFSGSGGRGSFRIDIANDNCAGAFPLYGFGITEYFYTGDASDSPAEPCGLIGSDVWYCWTADTDGYATASTCGYNTDYDTVVAVYDGCNCNADLLGCQDDASSDCYYNGLQSIVSWGATAGSSYLIRVGGYSSDSGDAELSITKTAEIPCFESNVPIFDIGSGLQLGNAKFSYVGNRVHVRIAFFSDTRFKEAYVYISDSSRARSPAAVRDNRLTPIVTSKRDFEYNINCNEAYVVAVRAFGKQNGRLVNGWASPSDGEQLGTGAGFQFLRRACNNGICG